MSGGSATAMVKAFLGAISGPAASKSMLCDQHALNVALAIQRLRMPLYSRTIDYSDPNEGSGYLGDKVNLWVICELTGVLELQLVEDGGASFTLQPVIAGQRIEGHFLRIGPGTTCGVVIGYGNMP
jgi:hypothetical protein